ncbi:hypothetical protein ACLB1N_27215 [Escherichia coli]
MDRAVARRNVVLSRMLDEGYITQQQFDQARTEAINANYYAPEIAFSTPYLSEMVRQEMYNRYGESAYEDGYRIYTTITRKVQQAAQQAVRNNVLDYDMRHGYRGPANVLWKVGESAWDNNKITDTLKALPTYGPLLPAAVTSADPQQATAMLADGSTVALSMEGVRWARPYRSDTQQGPTPRKVTDVLPNGSANLGSSGWRCMVAGTSAGSELGAGVDRIRKTVPLWRWSVALISIRASLTAPPRHCVRWVPTSNQPLHRGDG